MRAHSRSHAQRFRLAISSRRPHFGRGHGGAQFAREEDPYY